MNINKRRMKTNAFIPSEFGYCPLVLMFHSRKLNSRINKLHGRALRKVYQNYPSSFTELLEKDNFTTIHNRNINFYNHMQNILGICYVSLRILIWGESVTLLFGYFQQDSYGINFQRGDWVLGCSFGISFPFTQVP